jgi:hypothetical protein
MQLDYLKGKSILEVIADFSKFEWTLMDQIRPLKTKLKTLALVYYDRNKPRQEVDLYNHVDVHNTAALDELIFRRHDDRTLGGIISKVQLGQPFEEHEYKYAHIPMIDFDMHNEFDFLSEEEKINLIKSKIEEDTEINSGVILRSGPKRNYHFMGIGQLLSEDDFITFVGLALEMHIIREDKKINLADSRHLGHGLSPMKYMAELENEENPESQWSRYFFRERFLTLRIQPKPGYLDLPRVVDVMNPEIH